MNVSTVIADLDCRGYQLTLDGERIVYRGHGCLPDDLLDSMRKKKPKLMAWLRAKDKLALIAGGLEYPVDELLDFYQNDMPDIESMDLDTLRFIVADYIQNRKACRAEVTNG